MIGFYEALKVRAGEAKLDFPVRHDWDSFFRDAKNMNELRAGERPDTLYLAQLPVRWFLVSPTECDSNHGSQRSNHYTNPSLLTSP